MIRGVDDEATLTLAAGAIAARLSNFVVALVSIIVTFIFYLSFLVVVVLVYARAAHATPNDPVVAAAFYVIVVVALAFFWFVTAPGLFKSVFGRELAVGAGRCQLSSDSVPDIADPRHIEIVTLPPLEYKWGLRHAIYNHSECAKTIVRWLSQVRS